MMIDLTHTITPDIPVYPGTPSPAMSPLCTITSSGFRETAIALTSHTGTHMDAPSHVSRQGSSLDQLPVSQFCGRAVALDVSQVGPVITAEFLKAHHDSLYCAAFLLFYTGWAKKWGTGDSLEDTFPVPDEEAARYLVSCGLKGVGTDAISVDRISGPLTAHQIFLGDGMVIIECLCLKKVAGRKDFLFFALPLKTENADGAPVRAIAELRENDEKGRGL